MFYIIPLEATKKSAKLLKKIQNLNNKISSKSVKKTTESSRTSEKRPGKQRQEFTKSVGHTLVSKTMVGVDLTEWMAIKF